MNWKTIDENWYKFTQDNQIELEKSSRPYFYGTLANYKGREYFEGFKIVYENKLNKSAEVGSSYGIGHKIILYGIIANEKDLKLKITRKSFWNRLVSRSDSLNIKSNSANIERKLHMHQIEQLMRIFPDLKIEIKRFDEYQNEEISMGQPLLRIVSKHQPLELKHLNLLRELLLSILTILKKHDYIDSTNN